MQRTRWPGAREAAASAPTGPARWRLQRRAGSSELWLGLQRVGPLRSTRTEQALNSRATMGRMPHQRQRRSRRDTREGPNDHERARTHARRPQLQVRMRSAQHGPEPLREGFSAAWAAGRSTRSVSGRSSARIPCISESRRGAQRTGRAHQRTVARGATRSRDGAGRLGA